MAIRFERLRKWSRTYGFRLTLLYLALFGIVVSMLFAVIYWVTADFMEDQLHATIDTEMSSLVDGFDPAGADDILDSISRRLASPIHQSSYYLLQDQAGRKVAGNLPPMAPAAGWYDLPIPVHIDEDGELDGGEDSDTLMAEAKVLPGGWFLVVGQDADAYTDFEDLILTIAGWSMAAAFGLALIAGLVTSAGMLRRVAGITDASNDIMHGNMSRRIALRGTNDEFDRLSAGLNQMLDRIQALMEGLRQVSNDIAHDLRTPMSRLRQSLEMVRASAGTVAEYQAAVDRAIAETDEILGTFGALLRIAQIEAGTRQAAFTEVDLSEVLQTIAETYAVVAEDQQKVIAGRLEGGVTVRGDRQLLTQMTANIVENALSHTPAGTRIEISLSGHPTAPVCIISDNGPGIPERERRKVFRRFYRLDASRATPGNGLGLSLVAAVAELHRIIVELDDNRPGLRVALRFPTVGAA